MKKYLVYLTKSAEVAERIALTFTVGEDGVEKVSFGRGIKDAIPAVYHDEGYSFCIVTYNEDANAKPYRLVIA